MFLFFSFRTCHHDARLEIQNFLAAAGATETMMEKFYAQQLKKDQTGIVRNCIP
jgi:hypothetical protein